MCLLPLAPHSSLHGPLPLRLTSRLPASVPLAGPQHHDKLIKPMMANPDEVHEAPIPEEGGEHQEEEPEEEEAQALGTEDDAGDQAGAPP